jgi:Bacterial Ig domain
LSKETNSLFSILIVSCLTLLLISSSLFSGLSVTSTIASLGSTPVALSDILAKGDAATVQLASAQEQELGVSFEEEDSDSDNATETEAATTDEEGAVIEEPPDVPPPPPVPGENLTNTPPQPLDSSTMNLSRPDTTQAPTPEIIEKICDDGLDNDDDDLVDLDDSDCLSVVPANQSNLQNSPPVAYDQNVQTAMDMPIDITLQASDANPTDELTATIVSQPINGTLSEINQEIGNVSYTPNPGITGQDRFTFKVNDGSADSNIANASITVNGNSQNSPPVASDLNVQTTMNTTVNITLLATDADLNNLTATIVSQPINGTLSEINQEIGNVSYTPNPGITGQDRFNFTVNDGFADSNIATASITVNTTKMEPFYMLAIGDSVMWGQGLKNETKFHSLVENHIEKNTGLEVNKTVLAHSGAVIGNDYSQSEPLFRWNKVPGPDESKFRQFMDTFAIIGYEYIPGTKIQVKKFEFEGEWRDAKITKSPFQVGNAVGSTITIGPACISKTVCRTATFSQTPGDNKVDLNIKSSAGDSSKFAGDSSKFSLKLQDINGEPAVFHGNLHGEINTAFPTVLQQIRHFTGPPDPKDVDLVLVVGCINDFGAFRMLNPFEPVQANEVVKTCHSNMLMLLEETAKKFPSAKIIVTGYFQEISPDSRGRVTQLVDWASVWIFATLLGIPLLGPVLVGSFGSTLPTLNQIAKGPLLDRIISNWGTFHQYSTNALLGAVTKANLQNPCNDSTGTTTTTPGSNTTGSCPFKGKRISFADPKFGSYNAAFAPFPFLYEFKTTQNNPIDYYLETGKLPLTTIDPNEIKSEREQACNNPGSFAFRGSFDTLTCSIASIGHPNEAGARQYAKEICPIVNEAFGITAPCSQPPKGGVGPPAIPRPPPPEPLPETIPTD